MQSRWRVKPQDSQDSQDSQDIGLETQSAGFGGFISVHQENVMNNVVVYVEDPVHALQVLQPALSLSQQHVL
ncbi:MAG: hypothetical protein LH479_11995, partial [Polaromonas sp.]|nr:hypothetical protein [Polaromonas sp.]